MRAIIVLGWRGFESTAEPELIYCGIDGVLANKQAELARESGQFKRLGKLVNPSMVPLPAVPFRKPSPAPATTPTPVQQPATETPAPASEDLAEETPAEASTPPKPKAPKAPKTK